MRIIPLSFDSLGVRSSSVKVEAGGLTVLIDPWAALGPYRYGLPPHEVEKRKLAETREKLLKEAAKAQIVTVTHYHRDHYSCSDKLYKGKIVLAKRIDEKINQSQRRRGWLFKERIAHLTSKFLYADGKTFNFGGLKLKFSEPFPHGEENTPLGYVLMVTVEHSGRKVLFTSDVEGPLVEEAVEYMLSEEAGTIIVDGPATYLIGSKLNENHLKIAKRNLLRIIKESEASETLIIDHHLIRSLTFKMDLQEVYLKAEEIGKRVLTAAEYLNMGNVPLEAMRKELYSSKWF